MQSTKCGVEVACRKVVGLLQELPLPGTVPPNEAALALRARRGRRPKLPNTALQLYYEHFCYSSASGRERPDYEVLRNVVPHH